MSIPINDLLIGCKDQEGMKLLLNQAQEAYLSWKSLWSHFITAPLRKELIGKIKLLNEIRFNSDGGYPTAERHRVCFTRSANQSHSKEILAPLKGINIKGNFLFDRAEKIDFLNTVKILGASHDEIGDIWLLHDRGAQVICTPEASIRLNGKLGMVRDTEVHCESLEIEELNLPFSRTPKKLTSVEASTRIDAIASAGFGLSRAKIVNQIKLGRLRLNWMPINQTSRTVVIGDRIQLEDKGSLEVLSIELTKKDRWRIELLRQ